MLQTDPAPGDPLFECLDCGKRLEEADGRRCACGGFLRNIGKPRE